MKQDITMDGMEVLNRYFERNAEVFDNDTDVVMDNLDTILDIAQEVMNDVKRLFEYKFIVWDNEMDGETLYYNDELTAYKEAFYYANRETSEYCYSVMSSEDLKGAFYHRDIVDFSSDFFNFFRHLERIDHDEMLVLTHMIDALQGDNDFINCVDYFNGSRVITISVRNTVISTLGEIAFDYN